MPIYTVLKQPLRHNDVDYDPGDVVDVIDVHAEPLLAVGLLALAPPLVVPDDDDDVIVLVDAPVTAAEFTPVRAQAKKHPTPKNKPRIKE